MVEDPVGDTAGPVVRVMTLNVMGRQEDWPARGKVLAAGLSALRPDLVCLQDVIVRDAEDQAAEVLDSYRVAHQVNRAADGSGVSIASRWPILKVHEVDLRVTARAATLPCAVFAARVQVPPGFGEVLVVNKRTSFQFGAELERELEAVAAARLIEDLVAGEPAQVILASDLNAAPDTSSVRFWTGRQSLGGMSVCYQDAWEVLHRGEPEEAGQTFTRTNPLVARGEMPREPGRRIDYILIRGGDHGPAVDVVACARVLDEPINGVWPSDHYAVLADLQPL